MPTIKVCWLSLTLGACITVVAAVVAWSVNKTDIGAAIERAKAFERAVCNATIIEASHSRAKGTRGSM